MYKIVITDHFKKQLKKLVRKNKGLKDRLKEELLEFRKERAIFIGSGVYKIRIAGHNKGKSGGYRSYLFTIEIQGILTPLCIYSKSQKENLTYEELTWHLKKVKEELSERLLTQ